MKIVVTGSSGLIGTALVESLRRAGHDVVRLVRRPPGAPDEARWDPAAGHVDPGALRGVDAAVNLAGAGVGDRRWTPERQRLIRASRVDATRTLSTALAALDRRPQVLLNASAVGFYGDRGDEVLTEGSAAGEGFLASVVADWEAACLPAQDAGIRTVRLRTGLVMSTRGGAFGRLLPLFRLGLGGTLGRGRMWWPWITMEDQVGAMRFLLEQDVDGAVNLSAPEPARNADVTRALGRALHRPAVLAVPPPALRIALGGFADEGVLVSQRAVPQRLLDAGYAFTQSDLDAATRWLADR